MNIKMKKLHILLALLSLLSYHSVLAQRAISGELYQIYSPTTFNTKATTLLLSENFETETLPSGWKTKIKEPAYTWQFTNQVEKPFSLINPESKNSAFCNWAKTRNGQDEWLISPQIEIGNFASLYCDFYAGFSRTWIKNATLKMYVGVPGASDTTWTQVWDAATSKDTLGNSWQWHPTKVNISKYKNTNIVLAWRYTGNDGDLAGIDQITVIGGTASMETDILSFSITRQATVPVIDTLTNTIQVELLAYTDTSKLIPTFTLSAGAYSIPKSKDTISVNTYEPFEIKVFAADSVTYKIWEVNFKIASVSKSADITKFSVNGQTSVTQIDNINGIIRLEVPCTQNMNAVRPSITLSPGATINPPSGASTVFTDGIAKEYIVTAQDTAVKRKWLVYITVRDYRAEIVSFSVASQSLVSIIDTLENKVYVELAYGTNLNTVVPVFSLTDCASSVPASGEMLIIDPTVPLFIEITPLNPLEKAQTYEVYFTISKNYLMRQSFEADTLVEQDGWTVLKNNTKTWTIGNQPRVPFTTINKRSKASALIPWSETLQNEWLISPWIQTKYIKDLGYTDLTLEFYVGFNPQFLQPNANISVLLRRDFITWERVWQLPSENNHPTTWNWDLYNVALDGWLGDSVQIAFVYNGINADLAGIDDVVLFSDPVDFIQEKMIEEIFVYPNPASDVINLPFTTETEWRADIYTINGAYLGSKRFSGNEINIADLQTGNYLMLLKNKENKYKYLRVNKI